MFLSQSNPEEEDDNMGLHELSDNTSEDPYDDMEEEENPMPLHLGNNGNSLNLQNLQQNQGSGGHHQHQDNGVEPELNEEELELLNRLKLQARLEKQEQHYRLAQNELFLQHQEAMAAHGQPLPLLAHSHHRSSGMGSVSAGGSSSGSPNSVSVSPPLGMPHYGMSSHHHLPKSLTAAMAAAAAVAAAATAAHNHNNLPMAAAPASLLHGGLTAAAMAAASATASAAATAGSPSGASQSSNVDQHKYSFEEQFKQVRNPFFIHYTFVLFGLENPKNKEFFKLFIMFYLARGPIRRRLRISDVFIKYPLLSPR